MVLIRRVALVLVVCLLAQLAIAASDDEIVAFNTQSLKYHCVSCRWAKACTTNCIEIRVSEAKERGGVACKVCGGRCVKSQS